MSNQYISALQQVAAELEADLRRYRIKVDAENHTITWRDSVTRLRPYTRARDCRQTLKRLIKRAKEAQEREWRQEHQSSLL